MRWKAAFASTIQAVFFTESACIERINGGSDTEDRTTIIGKLKCTVPQWLVVEQKERAGTATVARILYVKTEVPSSVVKVRDRFIHNGHDYRVASPPQGVPATNPSHYLFYLEDES